MSLKRPLHNDLNGGDDDDSCDHNDYILQKNDNVTTFHSAMRALNACFHFVFFGALPADDENSTEGDSDLVSGEGLQNDLHNLQMAKERFLAAECECECVSANSNANSNENTTDLIKNFRDELSPPPGISRVIHCKQLYSWDCGLTCIQMILRWTSSQRGKIDKLEASADGSEYEYEYEYGGSAPLTQQEIVQKHWLMREVKTQSIWTIDLFILLQRIFHTLPKNINGRNHQTSDDEIDSLFRTHDVKGTNSISFLFCSANLGVNESYRSINYYKGAFRRDERRVKRLFSFAHERALNMTKINLDLDFVLEMISKPNIIAMALIDMNVLMGGTTAVESYLDDEYYGAQYDDEEVSSSFSGHYCLLIGLSWNENDISNAKSRSRYNEDDDSHFCIVVKDPGSSNPSDFVMPRLFYRSWVAKGTDNDIIFIADWQPHE